MLGSRGSQSVRGDHGPHHACPGFTTTVSALVHLEGVASDTQLGELEVACQDAQVALERVLGLMGTHHQVLMSGDAGEPG